MKIAELVWPDVLTPPKGYGPINLVAARIANGLHERGHDVTSFVAKGSKVSGEIVEIEKPESSASIISDPTLFHFVTIAEFLKRKDDFDVVHSHLGYASLMLLDVVDKPIVITLHGNYKNTYTPLVYKKYAQKAHFVAISEAQKETLPGINFAGTVYHGVDVSEYHFEDRVEDYMAYVGRTSPGKGIGDAIKIAIKLKKELRIAAHIDASEAGKKYYEKEIKPYLGNRYIKFQGDATQEEVKKLVSKARLFLYPIGFFEPFGLVVAEANACGTPVVTYNTGAMPELIKNNVNGMVCNQGDILEIEKAIEKIYSMPDSEYKQLRTNSREHIKNHFSVERMVEGYDNIFKKILSTSNSN